MDGNGITALDGERWWRDIWSETTKSHSRCWKLKRPRESCASCDVLLCTFDGDSGDPWFLSPLEVVVRHTM